MSCTSVISVFSKSATMGVPSVPYILGHSVRRHRTPGDFTLFEEVWRPPFAGMLHGFRYPSIFQAGKAPPV